jgi:hypothetical protein
MPVQYKSVKIFIPEVIKYENMDHLPSTTC